MIIIIFIIIIIVIIIIIIIVVVVFTIINWFSHTTFDKLFFLYDRFLEKQYFFFIT